MTFSALSEKFQQLSIREQALLLLTGIVGIVMVIFSLLIDSQLAHIKSMNMQNAKLHSSNQTLAASVNELRVSLQQDPNAQLKQQIAEYKSKSSMVDHSLLALTSELINPVEMRNALTRLLKLEKGVKLASFEVLPAEAMDLVNELSTKQAPASTKVKSATNELNQTGTQTPLIDDDLKLYRHGIKLTLTGSYFELRNYLAQLEKLPWKFFWQQFNYKLTRYPTGELEINMYSLSTKREFIGV